MNDRLFLSCVTPEFEFKEGATPADNDARFPGFRSMLARYLRKADCHVQVQEDFRQAAELDTVEKLANYIRQCQAVVHLLGREGGSVANKTARESFLENSALLGDKPFLEDWPELKQKLGDCSDLTYTQWEAFLALHYRVDLFIYATDDAITSHSDHFLRLKLARKFPVAIKNDIDLLGQLIGDLRKILRNIPELKQQIANSRFLKHSAEDFLGREVELAFLDDVWQRRINVLSLIAWGGVGKTSLVVQWIQQRFIDRQWRDDDAPALWRYFDWSFYDQGTGSLDDDTATRTGNVGEFFEEALAFFGDPDPRLPGKGKRLAELVRQQHSLLVLDGLEPLQAPPNSQQPGQLLDPDLHDLLVALAQLNPGLCLLTSRQAVRDLAGLGGKAAESKDLDELPKETAVRLLRKMQIKGTDQELAEACEKFDCHALSLTLLGRFLFDAHDGEIARIDRVNLRKADRLTRPERHRTAWHVLEAYDQWLSEANADPTLLAVLRLVGLFDRPATADCLQELRSGEVIQGLTEAVHDMDRDEWNILLKRLERAHLIRLRPSANQGEADIDVHPLVREYFAEQLRTKMPEAFQAAHSRLFDYLCESTEHHPDTLAGLQPLYEAVTHGCLAGRHQEACDKVYFDRILRGTGNDGFYSTNKLGAIGADLAAVAAYFDEPWSKLSPNLTEADQAWLLNQAAFHLRALGRLTEALQPMRAGLEMVVRQKNWNNAARSAGSLSELEVTLGRLPDAVIDARQSIIHADQSGDAFMRMVNRTVAADALHQSGQRAEAGALFAAAERTQQERQPQFDLLYSVQGFRYCDWLLAPAEHAAWQMLLRSTGVPPAGAAHGQDGHATICDEVERRATTTLGLGNQFGSLLDIGLDHLTLARVGLIRAILASPLPQPTLDLPHVAAAVNGLRAAGQMDDLPRGLLTASLYHFVRGEHDLARKHLAEAQQIAERGPMPLYLADIHLHRARMFHDKTELAHAAQLIRHHGYGRRTEELADAEEAANQRPT